MAEARPYRLEVPRELGACPACGDDLVATLAVEVQPGSVAPAPDDDQAMLTIKAVPLGLRISHDCVPRVTRRRVPPQTVRVGCSPVPAEQQQVRPGHDAPPVYGCTCALCTVARNR